MIAQYITYIYENKERDNEREGEKERKWENERKGVREKDIDRLEKKRKYVIKTCKVIKSPRSIFFRECYLNVVFIMWLFSGIWQ